MKVRTYNKITKGMCFIGERIITWTHSKIEKCCKLFPRSVWNQGYI